MSDEPTLGPVERLHPLFLITGLGGSLRRAGGAFAVLGYFAISGEWKTLLLVAPVLAVTLVAGLFLYWRFFQFRVGPSEIRIDSGFSTDPPIDPFDRNQGRRHHPALLDGRSDLPGSSSKLAEVGRAPRRMKVAPGDFPAASVQSALGPRSPRNQR